MTYEALLCFALFCFATKKVGLFFSRVIEAENIVEDVEASKWSWKQVEHLTELERMLFSRKLETAAYEHQHAAGGTRRLAIDCGNDVLALLERQTVELGSNVMCALDLLTFKRQHRCLIVQAHQCDPVGVELRVVVLHECLGQAIRIHHPQNPLLLLLRRHLRLVSSSSVW
jgi:hypothetical protein